MKSNRQYQTMLDAAVERLRRIDLKAAAMKAGLVKTPEGYSFTTFGQSVTLDPIAFTLNPMIDMWQHLTLLQYLEAADGSAPTSDWISMADLSEGGLVRGLSFDRQIDQIIAENVQGRSAEEMKKACVENGGVIVQNARADLCADFCFMPKFPMRLNLWLSDDEFPASGKLLINKGVKHCLGTEAIGTIGAMLIKRIAKVKK